MKNYTWINSSYMHVQNQLLEIPENFERYEFLIPFSQKPAVRKVKILGGGIDLVVKAFKFPQNPIPLRRRLKPNQGYKGAIHSKNIAIILKKRFFLVPEPIACLEFQKSRGNYQSYYVSRFWEANLNVKQVFRLMHDPKLINHEKFLKEFAYTIFCQHKCGIFHYDLNPGNILVNENDGIFNIAFIDFDQCRKKILKTEKRIMKSLIEISRFAHVVKFIGMEYAKLHGAETDIFIKKLEILHRKRKILGNSR